MFRALQVTSTSALRLTSSQKPSMAAMLPLFQQTAGFKWSPPKTTGHSRNTHRSNRAKEGWNIFFSFLPSYCIVLLNS